MPKISSKIRIQEVDGEKPKKDKNKLKWSNWFITINPNISPDQEDSNELSRALKKTLEQIFAEDKIMNYILSRKKNTDLNQTIESIDIDSQVEIGTKIHMVHSHVLMKIRHKDNIYLDYAKMKKKISDSLDIPLTGFYFHVDPFGSSDLNLQQYIEKTRNK